MKFIILPVIFLFSSSLLSAQEIALTFDDAPTSDGPLFPGKARAKLIIDHLKQHRVPAPALFVVTSHIDSTGRSRLEQYASAGFLLANHTHSHERIQKLGSKNYILDIARADSALRKMKGFVPWFRYPFLDEGKTKPARDSIRLALQNLKLTNGYVTIDNYDWYLNGLLRKAIGDKRMMDFNKLKEVYINHIWQSILFYDAIGKKILNRSPRHVLLLHENDLAALFLGDLISYLKQKGWTIISAEEAYKDPIASTVPDVLFNGQGRIGAMAFEKGMLAKDLVQQSEDEAYLDKLVLDKEVFKLP
jgi:peptidoglycan/xylan/chitin deacetylase (PgdA/CDA1 family)